MEFYLLKDGQRAGPFKIFQVIEMLRSSEVDETDLAWCRSVDKWMPLKDMPPLAGLVGEAVEEPDIEIADGQDAAAATVAREKTPELVAGAGRPWMRFIARTLDSTVCYSLVALVVIKLGVVEPAVFSERFMNGYEFLTVAGVCLLASYLWVFVEAFLISRWAMTPGKWLFQIRVTHEDDTRLTYQEALRRSLTVWMRGYGLGIPYMRQIACIMSFISLTQDGTTAWDEQQSLKVTHGDITRRRWFIVFGLMLAMVFARELVTYKIDPEFKEMIDEQIQQIPGLQQQDSEPPVI